MMKCIVCEKEGGNDTVGVITLQSTSLGPVCPSCIDRLVTSYVLASGKNINWKSKAKQKRATRAYEKWTR